LTTRSGTRRLAALLGLSAVWLLLLGGPALAHARLVETYPADGDTLAEPPEQVQLLFSEPIEAEFDPIKVQDQGGNRVDEDDARIAPSNRRLLVADLLEELPEGSYIAEWRVTSADGHPISGAYGFAVGASAAGGVGEPIESIERSADQEETGGSNTHIIHVVVLGLGVLVILVLTLLRKN
jgi:methionine-rich copper-binding protein CopC